MKLRKIDERTVEVYAESIDEESVLSRLSTHKTESGIVIEEHNTGSLLYFVIYDPNGDTVRRLIDAQRELNQSIRQVLEQ